MVGKIQRIALREVWKHEAFDFTSWLEENVDVLNDILDITLTGAEREKAAGDFSVDLVAEDTDGNLVVIENQLEKSDHDHLGKLITYATTIGSKVAIWIVAEPRPEHVSAISWLNESSSASFYLLKLEAIKIGDSEPAPLLTLIVGPSEEGREVGKAKKQMAERYPIRYRFWGQLLDYAKGKTRLYENISPSEHDHIGTSVGKRGLGYIYTVTQHASTVELYIDRGKGSEEENKAIFDTLAKSKEEIEKAFGEQLIWLRLEGKRACRIKKKLQLGGYRDEEEKWPVVHEAMVEAMIRLDKVLRPHIEKLPL